MEQEGNATTREKDLERIKLDKKSEEDTSLNQAIHNTSILANVIQYLNVRNKRLN